MNLPNKLTTSRFFITLIFVIIVLWDTLPYHTSWAALLFFIGGMTDIADGIIARRRNLQSDFGALMDPLADKILVTAGFILLVGMDGMSFVGSLGLQSAGDRHLCFILLPA